MAFIGGSIREVSIAGRKFGVSADADAGRVLGGVTNERKPNGNGTSRITKTAKVAVISGLMVAIDDNERDQEFLQNLANESNGFDASVTFQNGVTYSAVPDCQIEGDISLGTVEQTLELALSADDWVQQG